MKNFFIDTLERCIGTFAEALLGAIVGSGTLLGDIDWTLALSTAGFATLVTVLKCIIARFNGDKESASIIK